MPFLIETILDDIPTNYQILILILLAIISYMPNLIPILDAMSKKDVKRLKWINFLEYDEKIKCCRHDFKIGIAFSKFKLFGYLSGYIFIIYIFPTYIFHPSIKESLYALVLVSAVMSLAIYPFWQYVGKRISFINIYADFKRTNNYFSFMLGLTSVVTFAIILFIFFTILAFKYEQIDTPDFILICMIYLLIVSFLVARIKSDSNLIHKNLTHKLQFMLLNKYSGTFPHIYVKADARELQGKVQDIFNDNFIVFGYNGLKIPVEWDKITSIKLSEIADDEIETEAIQDATGELAKDDKSKLSKIKNYFLRLINLMAS